MFTLVEDPDPQITLTVPASLVEQVITALQECVKHSHHMATEDLDNEHTWRTVANHAQVLANRLAVAAGR